MSEYRISPKDRDDAARLNRRAQNAVREYELFVSRKAEELEVPWVDADFNLAAGTFTERKVVTLAPPIAVKSARK
jgi:hypothetical protein